MRRPHRDPPHGPPLADADLQGCYHNSGERQLSGNIRRGHAVERWKIEEVQKLRDDGMKAHEAGDHGKSEELINKATQLFKS